MIHGNGEYRAQEKFNVSKAKVTNRLYEFMAYTSHKNCKYGAVLSILKFPVNPAVNQVVMVVGNVAEYHSFGPVFFQSVI